MSERGAERIEVGIETLAATVFAAAVGFGVGSLLRDLLGLPQANAIALASVVAAYIPCIRLLDAVGAGPRAHRLPHFAVAALEPVQLEELLLTEADRLEPAWSAAEEPLELDDILASIGPDSRVVRLFDPKAMPTAGQLKARIDRHLDHGNSPAALRPAASPDASQALFDALAELRRSLA